MFPMQLCHNFTRVGGQPTKVVPSDLNCSSLPACALGLKRCGPKEIGGSSLCSPPLLLKVAGLDWRGPRLSLLPEPASRSGFSLAHDDGRRATIMGSSFPTCFFNASRDLLQVRSARDSSLRRFAPAWAISTPRARCPDFKSLDPGLASSPLPLRGGSPSGSPRSPICCREARLPRQPDLPQLPAFGTPTAVRGFGSATASEAGCSSKSLGTDSIFLPHDAKSQSDSQVVNLPNHGTAGPAPTEAGGINDAFNPLIRKRNSRAACLCFRR